MLSRIHRAKEVPTKEQMDQRELEIGGPIEQLLSFPFGQDPIKIVQIEVLLIEEVISRLLDFLWANSDVFAWAASDMLRIPPMVITHKLNIDPRCRSVH